eukprot:scaffold410934_cov25-Prasinocladus_malaysianus.AAC.1
MTGRQPVPLDYGQELLLALSKQAHHAIARAAAANNKKKRSLVWPVCITTMSWFKVGSLKRILHYPLMWCTALSVFTRHAM